MFTRDAEYFGHSRRVQGIPGRDALFAPRFLQGANELRRLEQLPWPRNLFGEPASIDELLAETAQLSKQADGNLHRVCPCGCRKEHTNNVSQTPWNPCGRGFDFVYFWLDSCKTRWNRGRMPLHTSG